MWALVRDLFGYAPRWLVVATAVLGLAGIALGGWLIATSIDERTETVPAQVSATYVRGDNVTFTFADGSADDQFQPGHDFYEAVRAAGPGPARVTRNADNGTIEKVRFHGKTYTLGSAGGSLAGGIVALVLGLLGVGYSVRRRNSLRGA
jgi:hypothetical protein